TPIVAPYGQMYLSILEMCILPILIAAIISSLGRLMKSEAASKYLARMSFIFIVAMLITSVIGLASGLVGRPGQDLGDKALKTLGSIVQKSDTQPDLEINFSQPWVAKAEEPPLRKFLTSLIPANIFNALSTGANLKVLFFSILCGLAVGFIPQDRAEVLFGFLDAVYSTFSRVVSWLMYALPFGLCGLIADQLSQVGMEILLAMTKFMIVAYAAFLAIFLLSAVVMWYRVRGNFFRSITALKEPIIISVATNNSLAAIPSTLKAMNEILGFEKRTIDLLAPVGITVCRFGPVLYFAVAAMFITQLYQGDMTLQKYLVVLIGAAMAGMATAGASGVVALAMMGLVLDPLGLPLDAVLVLLIVVDPLTAPFRSLTNVYTACAATAVIVKKEDEHIFNGSESQIWMAVQKAKPPAPQPVPATAKS
ncbi:MAG: cation:dicarboxylase symporter family transporter, partial [Thermodesulfobacteriota bacterium]